MQKPTGIESFQELWRALQAVQCQSVVFKMYTQAVEREPDICSCKDGKAAELYHARVSYLYQYFDHLVSKDFDPEIRHLAFPSFFTRSVFYKNTYDIIRKVVMLHPVFHAAIAHDTEYCDLRSRHFNYLAGKYHNKEVIRAFSTPKDAILDEEMQKKQACQVQTILWEPRHTWPV